MKLLVVFTISGGSSFAVNEGIANGRIDFAQYGALPNVIGRANRLPTRVLLNYGPTTIFGAARKGVSIHSIKDLKGHEVTFQKGTQIYQNILVPCEAPIQRSVRVRAARTKHRFQSA